MVEIKRPTLFTVEEAIKAKAQAIKESRYQDAMVISDLISLLGQASIYQSNERMILTNPRGMSQSASYSQVWQLIEDLSYQAVPEALRDKITALENKLSQGQPTNG